MTAQAQESLNKLNAMIEDTAYSPLEIFVKPATRLGKFQSYINGRLCRKAIDASGRIYNVDFRHLPNEEFKAYLYCINPDAKFFNYKQKYAVVMPQEFESFSLKKTG